jgi:hypothetical protein
MRVQTMWSSHSLFIAARKFAAFGETCGMAITDACAPPELPPEKSRTSEALRAAIAAASESRALRRIVGLSVMDFLLFSRANRLGRRRKSSADWDRVVC